MLPSSAIFRTDALANPATNAGAEGNSTLSHSSSSRRRAGEALIVGECVLRAHTRRRFR